MKAAGGSGAGERRGWMAAGLLALATLVALLIMGRPPICTCGAVELWHGAIDSGNSQHIADWYSPSHVIHGFLFFAAGWWLLPRMSLVWRYAVAVGVEGLWEILENSPIIIDRYRTATMALGYSGDSILNSMSDLAMMSIGFWFAARMNWRVTLALALAMELLTLWVIRDNLMLNILMLSFPVEAIKVWQSGG